MAPLIRFQQVSKRYQVGAHRSSLRDAIPNYVGRLLGGAVGSGRGQEQLWALRDVSFEVARGEILGLVGANGAGKTTVLKLLSKVTRPTVGRVEVAGRVSALIELGAGFHPDLTGRENVYLNGAILGLTRREIDERLPSIVSFAELQDHMDTPVKRYSSGMYVRLGFAVAAHVDPEILLIDEVLAVGDASFRDKCIKKIDEFRRFGKTMVVVSHDRYMIEQLCERAVLLHRGHLIAEGAVRDVMDQYYSGAYRADQEPASALPLMADQLPATNDRARPAIEITDVSVSDAGGRHRNTFLTGESLTARICFRVHSPVTNPVFYCDIQQDYLLLNGSNPTRFRIASGDFAPGDQGVAEVVYDQLNLLTGSYYLTVGVMRDSFTHNDYHRLDRCFAFCVSAGMEQGHGLVYLPCRWRLMRDTPTEIEVRR